MTELPALISAFTTLFIIIDAPGLVPVFIALTEGMSARQRRTIAVRACLVSAGLMGLFLVLGEAVLGFVGISMPAFRIAGGAVLFLTALDMLFERRQKRRDDNAESAEPDHDPSVFPLALPLIVGPGLITTIILLAGRAEGPVDFVGIAAPARGQSRHRVPGVPRRAVDRACAGPRRDQRDHAGAGDAAGRAVGAVHSRRARLLRCRGLSPISAA